MSSWNPFAHRSGRSPRPEPDQPEAASGGDVQEGPAAQPRGVDPFAPSREAVPAESRAGEAPSPLTGGDGPADGNAKVPLHRRQLTFGRRKESVATGTLVADAPSSAPVSPPTRLASVRSRRNGGRGAHRVVGLKIGASQIAAAVVDNRDGRHVLQQLVRTPLEDGVVVDGEVRDPAALASALRTFFAQHDLPVRDVRLGLASNRIGVRTFEIVAVDEPARLDNAVRFKAHEVLPVAVNESVLDYRVLATRELESGESSKRVLLVVAPRDQVQPYLDVCANAGLRLHGVDLEALGLLRAFIDPTSARLALAEDRATVVISIGHEASTLLVSGGGVAEFARVFDWGGAQLVDALAQELGTGSAEAEKVLRQLSLATGSARTVAGLEEETIGRAYEAVRLRLTPFARELVASLQFYQTQPDSLGIGEIVITGGTSQLTGLDEALHQIIGVPVRVGDPLARVVVECRVDSDDEAQIGSFAVPIGLAIEDEPARGVNLLPRDVAAVRSLSAAKVAGVVVPVAAAVPLLAAGFLFYQARNDVSDKESTLTAKEAELAALPQPTRPELGPGVGSEQQARATALSLVLGQRLAWDGVLRDVAKIIPGDVWLTSLTAKAPVRLGDPTAQAPAAPAGVPTAPTGVNIAGYTYKQDDVAELLARLSALPRLTNVQLGSATKGEVAGKTVVQFTILADLREAGR